MQLIHHVTFAWNCVDNRRHVGRYCGIGIFGDLVDAESQRRARDSAYLVSDTVTSGNLTEATSEETQQALQNVWSSRVGDMTAFALALFSSLFASYVAYSNPMLRWKQLKSAALQLRSQILKFRTRTGVYDYSVPTSDVLAMKGFVQSVRESMLARGGVSSSSFFKPDKKSIYKHEQYGPPPQSGNMGVNNVGEKTTKVSPIAVKKKIKDLEAQVKKLKAAAASKKNVDRQEEEEEVSGTTTTHTSSRPSHETVDDDHHSPMLAKEYITRRLEITLRFYQSRVSPYYRHQTVAVILLMIASATSAVLATLGLTQWIAIVSILAASVTSWGEFSGTTKKLGRYGTAITQLKGIRLWWDTLKPTEKAAAAQVNRLVSLTENVINHDARAWMATNDAEKAMGKQVASAKGQQGA